MARQTIEERMNAIRARQARANTKRFQFHDIDTIIELFKQPNGLLKVTSQETIEALRTLRDVQRKRYQRVAEAEARGEVPEGTFADFLETAPIIPYGDVIKTMGMYERAKMISRTYLTLKLESTQVSVLTVAEGEIEYVTQKYIRSGKSLTKYIREDLPGDSPTIERMRGELWQLTDEFNLRNQAYFYIGGSDEVDALFVSEIGRGLTVSVIFQFLRDAIRVMEGLIVPEKTNSFVLSGYDIDDLYDPRRRIGLIGRRRQ